MRVEREVVLREAGKKAGDEGRKSGLSKAGEKTLRAIYEGFSHDLPADDDDGDPAAEASSAERDPARG